MIGSHVSAQRQPPEVLPTCVTYLPVCARTEPGVGCILSRALFSKSGGNNRMAGQMTTEGLLSGRIDTTGNVTNFDTEKAKRAPGGGAANSNEADAVSLTEPHFRLVRLKGMKASRDPAYLVKGLIPKYGLVVVWGEPKCGKTFWVLDVVTHIALGIEYRGRRVKQGQIVYVSIEGTEGFKGRAEAICNKLLNDRKADPPFGVIMQSLNLIGDHKKLVADIKAQSDAPAAVVIDTLNRSLVGSESSDEDMAAYVKAADAVKDAFGCAVIVVHHCGHGGTRPRGHSSLIGRSTPRSPSSETQATMSLRPSNT
jgi:RecA-family ATPase